MNPQKQQDKHTATNLLRYFPIPLQSALRPYLLRADVTEIRVRINQPLQVRAAKPVQLPVTATKEDCKWIFESICEHSVYAWANELKQGFLTLPGGCRVGMAGRGVVENGVIQCIHQPTYFNFRIAREWIGCAKPLLPYLMETSGRVRHTLILSPPGCGKTTMLRDLVRTLSYRHYNVLVIDERSEIAGSRDGVPSLDVGPCCDVLDSCPKHQGMLFALRVMSPEVLVFDEIGEKDEFIALYSAMQCGASVITSAHAANVEEFCKRFASNHMKSAAPFERYVLLGSSLGPGTIELVVDQRLNPLDREGEVNVLHA